jgi:hypothetical protein
MLFPLYSWKSLGTVLTYPKASQQVNSTAGIWSQLFLAAESELFVSLILESETKLYKSF